MKLEKVQLAGLWQDSAGNYHSPGVQAEMIQELIGQFDGACEFHIRVNDPKPHRKSPDAYLWAVAVKGKS